MSQVKIALRFDTEDYITKESNDALFEILKLLNRLDIKATFPLVGKKIQFLVQEERNDILRLLSGHSLGYHSYSHSRHPTISERLAEVDWKNGISIFESSEFPGLELFREVLDKNPVCYTQPGGNWVPHAFPVLYNWNIPIHFSEAWNSYLDLGYSPYYYQDVLTWSAPVTAPKPMLNRIPFLEEETITMLSNRYNHLMENNGGTILIVAHPTELVTLEYWDIVNFGSGMNHSRTVPRLRKKNDVKASIVSLERILKFLRSLPKVNFITADDLIREFSFPSDNKTANYEQIEVLVRTITAGNTFGYLPFKNGYLSPAEAFSLLVQTAMNLTAGKQTECCIMHLSAPENNQKSPLKSNLKINARDFKGMIERTYISLTQGNIPSSISFQGISIRPEEFAWTLAGYLLNYFSNGKFPVEVSLKAVEFTPRKCLKSLKDIHWDWPVFAPEFEPLNLYKAAEKQLWTLKPAVSS